MSKATEYKNKYIAANYDRINLTVPFQPQELSEDYRKNVAF